TVGLEDYTGMIGLEYTYSNRYPTAAKHLQDNMAILFTTNGSNIVEPPIIEINQEIFHFVVQPGESDSQILEISNLGQANLIYNISKNYQESIEIVNSRDYGGPDNYGYQWIDSNEPDGPEYNWIDISDMGTEVYFNHNDEGTDLMPIGFTFNYYGIDYNQFRINPNGWIGFGDDNTEWINSAVPSSDAPRPAILPFWDDLNPLEGGNVLYYSTSDSLIVWFDNVIHYVGDYNGTYDFEVIIYPDGEILFQYRTVTGDIDTATIGIQNESGNDGLQMVYNDDYVENQLAIRIRKVVDWLAIDPVNGMIPAGETDNITLSIGTDELEIGEYLCDLMLYSNDPNSSLIEIPVNLIVMSINPEIDVSVSEIDYGTQYIGESSLDSLTITNLGEDPLTVFEIYSDNEDYTVDITEFELVTGQTQQVYVTFSPTSEGEITGDLFILSNDPDESTFIVNLTGTGEVLINIDEPEIAFTTSIKQNYPNPFHLKNSRNGITTINFSIANESTVRIDIYNILGQKTKTIIDQNLIPGNYQAVWDGTDIYNKTVSSGIYFYRFSTDDYIETKKMLIIR
ncbi:MAG TPA: choice-of-anchor D domain-containing protein, partial [Candidatus Cloacimonetes bacterium]|nr:choice-of-anchor D domain-containing protein [Candidatus Cloacimonadota bacterium]